MGTEEFPVVKKTLRKAFTRLKQERERRGWSQSELAERIKTNQVNVSRWEKGITIPGPYFRQRLSELFGKSLEELGLFTEAEHESNEEVSSKSMRSASPAQLAQMHLWNVSYRRNPFFTGREEVLSQVYNALNTNKAAALTQAQAISGLGGIGKTQIAIEYAYRYHANYQSILWVTASSRDTLIADFVMLAALLDLPEQHEKDQDIVVRAMKRWLSTHKGWLLILDNVDDLEMVVEFLPMQGEGNVLLTTRLQALGTIAQSIEVEKMELEEGVTFLLRRAKAFPPDVPLNRSEQECFSLAEAVVTALDGLPLALDQAGAYIEETRCGFSAYLDLYRTHRKDLLLRRGRFPADHPESVAATWSLSFQQVEMVSSAAADLLHLLAFLSPEAIPEEIITDGAADLGSTLGLVASDPLQIDAAIELLLRYSLLRRNPEAKFLSIHRLVQAVIKDGMDKDLQRTWAERAIHAISKAFPEVERSTWDQCRRFLPHALISAVYLEEYDLAFPEAADLLNKAATYLIVQAQYVQAEPLLKRAQAIREKVLVSAHPDTARTLNDLGALYLTQGIYKQAKPHLQQALDIRQKKLGLDHPDTATSLHNLAELYNAEGNYLLAEEFYQSALHIRQQVLKHSHPDIAQSLNKLAELYTVQAKFSDAETLYKQALEIQEQALGHYHPDVAKTHNNMALLYRHKGEYSQAEQFYKKALSIQKQILGTDHPDVAQTLNNMARLYRAQGEYVKAEPYYREAQVIRQKVFGPDHPQVAESYYSLAKLYHSQGKYRQAEEFIKQSLEIQEQQLGRNHPTIAPTLGMLARIYQGQGKQTKAEELYQRAVMIRESTLGSDHPHIALLVNSLAEIYHEQGKYSEARALIVRSVEIRERAFGRDHPYMAYSLSNLAENSFLQGDFVQAEKLYKEALANREQNLGPDHPRTATAYHSLAKFYTALNRYAEAESLYKSALAIRERALGPEHPAVASTLEHYAILLRKTGQVNQAGVFDIRAQVIRANQSRPEGP
jgi:tetratricopeptide (TPR) repeat protein